MDIVTFLFLLAIGLVSVYIFKTFLKRKATIVTKQPVRDEFTEIREMLSGGNEGWTAYKDTPQVSVWVKNSESSAFVVIKGRIVLESTTAKRVFHAIWDPSFRQTWDDVLSDYKVIEEYTDYSDLTYYYAKSPMPFMVGHREFIQVRSYKVEDGDYFVLYRHADKEDIPVKKDCVRAVTIISGNIIGKGDAPNTVVMDFISQNDVKGNIPPQLTNTFAPGKCFDWLKKLVKAVNNVPDDIQ
ncbi:unnamed protein product [Blepharisma stoltei]|uniref:START domain-containing protein n=1 Tax=Blepharisma stoltei TaxID=1481888 RepID=A0AAU9IMG5_9CILI|nr:unnamed protein product [Blepharisma stoltei]